MTTQFSLRIDDELLQRIDEEAEQEYKTRTELIKEAVQKLLAQKQERERLKKIAAELWLKGELPTSHAKKALNDEELQDLAFGKKWVEDTLNEIRG